MALSVVAAITAATGASAADLPVAPAAAPALVYRPAMYDWTGIYFGGSLGAGLLSDDATALNGVLQPSGSSTRLNPYGLVGGGQIGVNFEFAPFVVGFEATWLASNISGSQVGSTVIGGFNDRATSAPHWYGTATARLGYADNDVLAYVKGGGAFMRVDYTEDLLNTTGALVSSNIIADSRTGWTVGIGLEYAFNESLSARIEYDFLDFGTKNYTYNLVAVGPVSAPFSIQSDTHLFTVGFNYRFNWVQRSPVVAKY